MSIPTTPNTRRESSLSENHQLHFSHLLRSEFIKLSSLQMTYIALGMIVAAGLSTSLLFAFTLESAGLPSVFNVDLVLDGVTMGVLIFGQVIAGTLGVLCISAEYSSGTVQSTFLAAPKRLHVLAAKAVVLFPIVASTALITVFGSWAATYPLFAEFDLQADPSTPGFMFALVGVSFYLGLCAVLGLGIGTVMRSAAGGTIVVLCMTLMAPILTSVLPSSEFVRHLRLYLMGHAGDSMGRIGEVDGPFADASDQYLSPLGGWITALVWAIVGLIAAAIVLRRRDV